VADGLADRVDLARTARLRLTGNGVVPLQAAYAWRVLRERFAASDPSAPSAPSDPSSLDA
jgi:DNA (cytosine-5)-methyltransferase 1